MLTAPCCTDAWLDAAHGRMRRALRVHLDPRTGSHFWRERAASIGVTADDLRTLDDLAIFGPMDEEAMRTRSIDEFIPISVRRSQQSFVFSETGGTTGAPKMVAFTQAEFLEGFVDPFLRLATALDFPRGGRWLFVGPTGPHIIGRAARHLALGMGADEPFTVDFDPRWHRQLQAGSLAQRRHTAHIVSQAVHVLGRADVESLFITPSILRALLPQMTWPQRRIVRGVHLGGQAHSAADVEEFQEALPGAVIFGGYGNSLVGVCNEMPGEQRGVLCYHAGSPRHVIRLLRDPSLSLSEEVEPGERGRVMFHRFDESFLILNMVERDEATRLVPSEAARALDLAPGGIADPRPVGTAETKPMEGIY